jgi:hypothetical protein
MLLIRLTGVTQEVAKMDMEIPRLTTLSHGGG